MEPRALGDHSGSERKVLGLNWVPATHQLMVSTDQLAKLAYSLTETKHAILRIVARFYDPLGLLAPLSVRVKMMLKSLGKKRLDQGQCITEDIQRQWRRWLRELTEMSAFGVSTAYGLPLDRMYHLHVFTDASQDAFAVVVYLRTVNSDPLAKTTLLMCKSRLAPDHGVTINRLELTAANSIPVDRPHGRSALDPQRCQTLGCVCEEQDL